MSDILKQLRDLDPNWTEYAIGDLVADAADHIETLRKCNHNLLAKNGHLLMELDAWQRTFPMLHVRPGAMYASTKVKDPDDATEGGTPVQREQVDER